MTGQEEDLGHQSPPTLPSLPLSELTIICVLVAAQRKSSLPGGGELSPSSVSDRRYNRGRATGWLALFTQSIALESRYGVASPFFTPSFALGPRYGLVSSLYSILAQTEPRGASSMTICSRSFESVRPKNEELDLKGKQPLFRFCCLFPCTNPHRVVLAHATR